ncbi:glycosyltransferase family A protein [Paenarthrobacter sp. NPDC089316]|uniref:glycosyltransferase family 2 protein n=1 Tax=Paenarthrobacter sp. NPDC089316 TaxID=3154974 RepID=UPI00342A297B
MIPSTGRDSLGRAIESVRGQDFQGHIELVVVFDLNEASTPVETVESARGADKVLFTGGGRKGGFARNLGVERSSGTWVAFLDDDDEWFPSKITEQVRVATHEESMGRRAIVGCRVEQVSGSFDSRHVVSGIPAKLVKPNDRIENYLFVDRRPGAKRASFFTSTVLASRRLCQEVRWDESLARHQDWDWLVRASRVAGTTFVQLEGVLVSIHLGSQGSISAGADWQGSLAWATRLLRPLDKRVYVDFLAAQTLRYALQKRDWSGVRSVLSHIVGTRSLPGVGPIAIGIAGVVPRASLQWLMQKIR